MTNDNEIAVGIFLFNNIFTNSMEYIQNAEQYGIDWITAEVLVDPKNGISGNNYSARDTDLIILNDNATLKNSYLKELREQYDVSVEGPLKRYQEYYWAQYEKKQDPQLLRYGKYQRFNDHVDDHPKLDTRRISMTYYLNDDYTGGEIEFPRFNLKIKPKAGQLLIFPSTYVYNHKINPVTSGNRYCIVQWLG